MADFRRVEPVTILLACVAGALFGALTVATRWGVVRSGDPEAGAFMTTAVAAGVGIAAALAAVRPSELAWHELWPFLAIGVLIPGTAQVLFLYAVRAAGASRVAIVIGMAPLTSAVIAVGAFGERPHAALYAGTVLIVLAGASLAWERARPVDFRAVGIALAVTMALLFGLRDNLVRVAAEAREPPPVAAAAATLVGGAVAVLLYMAVRRRRRLTAGLRGSVVAFLPAGLALGLAYVALVAAFDRGSVTLVAPFNATQSLWGVLLAAIVLGRSDAVGRRLILAALLMVGGSALVGAFH